MGRRPAAPEGDPHRQRPLGVRAGQPDGEPRAAGLRLRRVRAEVLPDDLRDTRRLAPRPAGRGDDARRRAGPPARDARPRPRRVGAAEDHVSRGRHPGAADVAAHRRPTPPDEARRAAAPAARRGRADHRLGLPHPRTAVPQGVPHRGRRRPAGRRTSTSGPPTRSPAATWTCSSDYRAKAPGHAVRPPDRRALHAALRHARRGDGRRRRPASRSSTATGWGSRSGRCRWPRFGAGARPLHPVPRRLRPRRQLRRRLPPPAPRPRGVAGADGQLLQPHRVRRVARAADRGRRRRRRHHRDRRAGGVRDLRRGAVGLPGLARDRRRDRRRGRAGQGGQPRGDLHLRPGHGQRDVRAASSTRRSRRSTAPRSSRWPTC